MNFTCSIVARKEEQGIPAGRWHDKGNVKISSAYYQKVVLSTNILTLIPALNEAAYTNGNFEHSIPVP